MFTKAEKNEHSEDQGYSDAVRSSIAAVSQIVDNMMANSNHGDSQENNEEEALISPKQDDSAHGEGVTPGAAEKAPYQDESYGEQPPISLEDNVKPAEKRGIKMNVTKDQLMTSRKIRGCSTQESEPTEDEAPANPFKHTDLPYTVNPFFKIPKKPKEQPETKAPETANPFTTILNMSQEANTSEDNIPTASPQSPAQGAFTFTNLHKLDDLSDEQTYDNVALELGMTPETHPQYFSRKAYKLPLRILYNRKCQYCMIISGFVMLTLAVAAMVTKGFEAAVKNHNAHSQGQEDQQTNTNKGEKLDWWLDEGGNALNKQQFEAMTYKLEDSYLPIWFDRKSGWEGQTYEEAMEFCKAHDDFMPCPYDVYCPGKTGKLIEGTMDDGISWAPFRDESDGWVQVGAAGTECDVFLGGNENANYQNWEFDEDMTKHVMCCLQTPLGSDMSSNAGEDGNEASFEHNLDLPDAPVSDADNSPLDMAEIDKWLLSEITEKYNPRWYDRESKWEGQTYQDAMKFCNSMNKVPCPYGVYCPNGPTGNLIFDVKFEEGEAWAATSDRSNQYVMVGHDDVCNRVTALNPAGYGKNNGNIDVLSHLMCCNDVLSEVHEDVTAAQNVDSDSASVTGSASNTTNDPVTIQNTVAITPMHNLTELEHAVTSRYIPFWFGFKDGWSGGTYESAREFCESVDPGRGDNFHLCPLMAYCPNGPHFDKPLFLKKEAFEGEQWAPTNFAPNAWILIGKLSGADPQTCSMYQEINKEDPQWGLDGSEPGLKQHILCCKGGSRDDDQAAVVSSDTETKPASGAAALTDNTSETSTTTTTTAISSYQSEQGSIQGMPAHINYGTTHNGAGNSSPHGGTTTHEAAVVVHLNPIWFNHAQGWNGGSHDDAETFCSTQGDDAPLTLCPYDAYCPQGPTSVALGGPDMIFATQEQYAPYHGDNDHWVLIGRFNGAKTTTCLDYNQLFGETPSWAYDDSRKELKQHVLCCMSSETLQSSHVVGIQTSSTTSSTTTTTTKSTLPDLDDTPGTWYGVEDGWNGGSRIDAIRFCYNRGEDTGGIPLMLCPYEAYCPDGPSNPIAPGNNNVGINESAEQWSPSLSKPNHWILVGTRGDNDSTTCLDTWQLEGDENPSWGLDESNAEHKHHVKCCHLN